LPGSPDLVFPSMKKVIFVHGCFWHRHFGCRFASTPKTRAQFWSNKFDRNVCRDAQAIESLEAAGWEALVVWECQTRKPERLTARLETFFRNNRGEASKSYQSFGPRRSA
jgi:DNA mismatch endonuclease, patch repair protein